MTVRGVQLRVVLIPLTVAAVLVAAIMWYRLFWIPGQQQ
jgi:type II secretory pathway component PulK